MTNEYVSLGIFPGLEICVPCPANSTSSGGNTTMCTCDPGTGRVNDTDVTLPCLGEYVSLSAIVYESFSLCLHDFAIPFHCVAQLAPVVQ